jgi:Ca-activated chloride channel family protein
MKLLLNHSVKSFIWKVAIMELVFWVLFLIVYLFIGQLEDTQNEAFGFKNSDALWLLVLPIPLAVFYIYRYFNTEENLLNLNIESQSLILNSIHPKERFLRYFFFRNTLVFLIFTMAQPYFGTKKADTFGKNIELVLCLDVSNSMNTRDISDGVSRLDVAKRSINQLINTLRGERIGVAIFAENAYVQLPITNDYGTAKMFINEIQTDMVSNQGTNIEAALQMAYSMFSPDKTSKSVLLITDGENHFEDPNGVIQELKAKEIAIHVMGIGSENGGLVPEDPNRPELGNKLDENGSPVISKLNTEMIKNIANASGGTALLTSEPFPDLSGILTEINQMKSGKVRDLQLDVKNNLYYIPLLFTLIFLICYQLWNATFLEFLKLKKS